MIDKHKAGCDSHGSNSLRLEEALDIIIAAVTPISDTERLPVRDAISRVLAADISSAIDVPGHTNSAMDGYALRADDLASDSQPALKLIGTSLAGQPYDGEVNAGECVRIMTGAVLPQGADTVVMQENVQRDETTVRIDDKPARGNNVRLAGEDISAGSVALSAGIMLEPSHIGLLASIGIAQVDVFRRAKVAFFSTGDELREVGTELAPGQIYDSNRYSLYSMLHRLGVEIVDLGVVRDRPDELEQAFQKAARDADAIVTSGGVSVGDADYVMEIFERLGEISFWSVAMKPGRPTAFGKLGRALYFGLPGNPVSVMATFYQLVRPALLKMSGQSDSPVPILINAICRSKIKTGVGRREFQRGVLSLDEQGQYVVDRTGQQGSGILSSMARGNCFIVIPEEQGQVEAGSVVQVQPFQAFV